MSVCELDEGISLERWSLEILESFTESREVEFHDVFLPENQSPELLSALSIALDDSERTKTEV